MTGMLGDVWDYVYFINGGTLYFMDFMDNGAYIYFKATVSGNNLSLTYYFHTPASPWDTSETNIYTRQ
jgi:hypothetical protein